MQTSSFRNLFWLSQILGIATCVVTVYWVIVYRGGLTEEFNWHIISGTVGMVYFFAFELLTYRLLRWFSIKTLHLLHAGVGVAIILSIIIVYLTVYDVRNRNRPEAENWTTLHDWIGMLTTFMFVAQWVFSVTAYLYPKMSVSIRVGYLPFHIFIGHITFGLVVVTCLSGLIEMSHYKRPEDYVLGFITFLMIGFTTLVVYLSTTHHYRRMPLESDKQT